MLALRYLPIDNGAQHLPITVPKGLRTDENVIGGPFRRCINDKDLHKRSANLVDQRHVSNIGKHEEAWSIIVAGQQVKSQVALSAAHVALPTAQASEENLSPEHFLRRELDLCRVEAFLHREKKERIIRDRQRDTLPSSPVIILGMN